MEIIWADSAKQDLNNIQKYISIDSEYHAEKLIDRIIKKVDVLKRYPEIGRPLPNKKGTRQLIEPPYRIFYRVLPEHIRITHVYHFKQNKWQKAEKENVEVIWIFKKKPPPG